MYIYIYLKESSLFPRNGQNTRLWFWGISYILDKISRIKSQVCILSVNLNAQTRHDCGCVHNCHQWTKWALIFLLYVSVTHKLLFNWQWSTYDHNDVTTLQKWNYSYTVADWLYEIFMWSEHRTDTDDWTRQMSSGSCSQKLHVCIHVWEWERERERDREREWERESEREREWERERMRERERERDKTEHQQWISDPILNLPYIILKARFREIAILRFRETAILKPKERANCCMAKGHSDSLITNRKVKKAYLPASETTKEPAQVRNTLDSGRSAQRVEVIALMAIRLSESTVTTEWQWPCLFYCSK